MGLRETKKSKTRRDILTVGRELFLKRGFEATRVRDIARRLQVSEQTVFNYFPSKQAIVEALAQEWVAENTRNAVALARPVPPGATVLEPARLNLAQYLAGLSEHRDFVRLLLDHSSLASPPPINDEQIERGRSPLLDLSRVQLRLSAEMYRAAQRNGEIRSDVDPTELAEMVFHIVGWSLRTWVDTEPAPRLLETVFRRVRLLMGGVLLGPPPDLRELLARMQANIAPAAKGKRGS
jgi:AcrR family transcriptional regulator